MGGEQWAVSGEQGEDTNLGSLVPAWDSNLRSSASPENIVSGYHRRRFLTSAAAGTAAGIALGWHAPQILRAADAQWGDLVGRFVYDGPAPERKKLKVDKDIDCCGKFDIRDESLMVGKEGALANVFVYLRTRGAAICPELAESTEKRVKLDNRDCIFVPHVHLLWLGKQEFYTVNSDPVAQNIAINPPGDTPVNVILPVGKDAVIKFNRAQMQPQPIYCNYHPWESAHILIRENPYMAVSGVDGTFRIAKLPLGKWDFQIWQERAGYLAVPGWPKGRCQVTIKRGTNDLGTIKIAPARLPLVSFSCPPISLS